MNNDRSLIEILIVFAPLSLLALGGGNSILGDLQDQAVIQHTWLTQKEFIETYAVSRVTPGPGSLIVTLIGWHVAGWLGALVATFAIVMPSSLLFYGLARAWHSGGPAKWRRALSHGLAPIAAGLILASVGRLLVNAEAPIITFAVAGTIATLAIMKRGGHIPLLITGALLFAALSLIPL